MEVERLGLILEVVDGDDPIHHVVGDWLTGHTVDGVTKFVTADSAIGGWITMSIKRWDFLMSRTY